MNSYQFATLSDISNLTFLFNLVCTPCTLNFVLDNGTESEIVVPEKIYELAMDGEPLDVCHRESPFGVILLDIHAPQNR